MTKNEALRDALKSVCNTFNSIGAALAVTEDQKFGDSSAVYLLGVQDGKSQQLNQEPVGWISRESLHRLKQGGNHAGIVPIHANRTNTSYIAMYVKEQP